MIEAEVHSSLRDFLRTQGQKTWPHHLTMARLVARALRLGRSSLIQTETYPIRYRLSYLTPALLWKGKVVIVSPAINQEKLLDLIAQLQFWLETNKKIYVGDLATADTLADVIITTPETWLAAQLQGKLPSDSSIPTLIEQAEDLETWTRQYLTHTISPEAWQSMMVSYPQQVDLIRDLRVRLTKAIFSHPPNPYECYLIEAPEEEILQRLFNTLEAITNSPQLKFWRQWQQRDQLHWVTVARSLGQFSLHCTPVEVNGALSQMWSQQPIVFMGGFLDQDTQAPVYRQQLGITEDLTCVRFSPNRQNEHIQLYIPDFIPLPNTPKFSEALLGELRKLLSSNKQQKRPVVILVADVPLKAQVGSMLAAEFGSLVQVESENLTPGGILISGWEFWRYHQQFLPTPQLLVIATLPFPSLENPIVAGKVAYYKRKRQDWFRLYLLPAALREIQRAVMPLRDAQGTVALLDSRVIYRSYGTTILDALEPYARINYLDLWW